MSGTGGFPFSSRAARAVLLGAVISVSVAWLAPPPASARAASVDACGRYTATVDFEAAGVAVGQGVAVAPNGGPSRSPVCVAVRGGPTFWAYCLNDELDPCAPADRQRTSGAVRFTRDRSASAVAGDPRFDYPWRQDQLTLARLRWVIDHGDESTPQGRFAIAQAVWFLTGQRATDPSGLGRRARQAVTAVAAQPVLAVRRLTPEVLPVGRAHVFQVVSTQRSLSFVQRPGITPYLCDATGRTVSVPGISVSASGLVDQAATTTPSTYGVCFLGTGAGSVRLDVEAPNPLLQLDIWYPTSRGCQGFFDALRSVPQPLSAGAGGRFGSAREATPPSSGPPVTLPATGASTPAPVGLAVVLLALGAGVTMVGRLRRRPRPGQG